MAEKRALGVGIIGCGAISDMHIRSFGEIPETRVVAVASRSPARAKSAGAALGAPSYTDYHALLARGDVDLVCICTPSGTHGEIAVAAARAGKHIVVEKPIEVTLARIDGMIAAARENNVKLSCIFNNRFRDGHRFVKRAIEAGRLGRMISAHAEIRWYRTPAYYASSDWKGSWALDGGGALMNQGIHTIDLLLWYAGAVRRVFGYAGTLLHRSIEAEDTAVAALQFENGALGSIVGTTSTYPGFPSQLYLTGERGTIVVRDGFLSTWAFTDKDPLDEEAKAFFGETDNARASDPMAFDHLSHKRQLEQVVASIRSDTPPPVGGEEARKSVELILQIYQSARTGTEVFSRGESLPHITN